MNRKRIAQYCCAALVAAGVGLNIQNAIVDYGIGLNSLSLVAGPGSNSDSNSNSNSNSNTNTGGDSSDLIADKTLKNVFKPINTGGGVIAKCCRKKENKYCDKKKQDSDC